MKSFHFPSSGASSSYIHLMQTQKLWQQHVCFNPVIIHHSLNHSGKAQPVPWGLPHSLQSWDLTTFSYSPSECKVIFFIYLLYNLVSEWANRRQLAAACLTWAFSGNWGQNGWYVYQSIPQQFRQLIPWVFPLASQLKQIININLINIELPNGPEPESVIDIAAIQLLSPEVINLNAIQLLLVHDECIIDISAIQLEWDFSIIHFAQVPHWHCWCSCWQQCRCNSLASSLHCHVASILWGCFASQPEMPRFLHHWMPELSNMLIWLTPPESGSHLNSLSRTASGQFSMYMEI